MYFAGKTTVVIDVLRATSVISTALENGAKEIALWFGKDEIVEWTRSIDEWIFE